MRSGLKGISQGRLYILPAANSHFQLKSRRTGMQLCKIMIFFFFFPPKETRGVEGSPRSPMGLNSLQAGAGRLTCGSAGSRGRGICSGTPPAQAPTSGKGKRRFTANLRLWEPKRREFLSSMTSLIGISSGTAWGERDVPKKKATGLVGLNPPPRIDGLRVETRCWQ